MIDRRKRVGLFRVRAAFGHRIAYVLETQQDWKPVEVLYQDPERAAEIQNPVLQIPLQNYLVDLDIRTSENRFTVVAAALSSAPEN